ncbi:MAG: fibronectin type III domain-containing protein [Chitinivibrionales bacterium]|nr:fibronectin type III domain-containing protein [Chitinivibrionales bacterium]
MAYKLSAAEEAQFSTTDGIASPFWAAWDSCPSNLDYQYCDPSCCAGGTVPMVGPLDAQLTVYAAYGQTGLYLYLKVEDDSWIDYHVVANNQYGDYSEWANDAVNIYLDNQPSSAIYAAYDAGTALGVGTKTPSTRQYLLRFGGSTLPTAMYINEFNPAYLTDNTLAAFTLTPHTFANAAATLGIKNDIIGQISGNTRVQEWIFPWSQIGNPGLTAVPTMGTMTACNIGYNDVDVGMTSGVKALRVGKNGDPGGPCIATCDPVNHPNWQNIQYGPMLDDAVIGCTWQPAATKPSAPVLSSPTNAATGVAVNPTLSWNPSTGATSYALEVSTNSNFTRPCYVDSVNEGNVTAKQIIGLSNNVQYYWRVNATNAAGTSAWSLVRSFTTIGMPPGVPTTPISPVNAATGITLPPTISWTAGSGAAADSFHLQVSTDGTNFTSPIFDNKVTTTSQSVTGLSNITQYYWRVKAINAAGTSAWSSAWGFTTIVVTSSAPSVPTLSSPANAITSLALNPTLTWNASTGATSYSIQVSTDSSGFSSPVVNQSGLAMLTYNVTGLVNNTKYFWRVNATNASGTSAWCAIWSFTTIVAAPAAPALISPANAATGVAVNPTLGWNASAGASSYSLQVATDAGFSSKIVDQNGLVGVSYNATGLTNNTSYYWRVNATNAGGTSAWSSAWSFTTANGITQVPSAPFLSSPATGSAGLALTPTFTWNATAGATSYSLQVSTDSIGFPTTVVNLTGLSSLSYAVTSGLSNNTKYYWRVNAANAGGSSAWSSVWSFTTIAVVAAAPAAPTLSWPTDFATDVDTMFPSLQWNASIGATSYEFQLSADAGFSYTLVDQSGLTTLSYAGIELTNSMTYYWRVNATNAGGISAWSTVWSFTTVTTAPAAAHKNACGQCGTGMELAFIPAIGTGFLSFLRKRKSKKKSARGQTK